MFIGPSWAVDFFLGSFCLHQVRTGRTWHRKWRATPRFRLCSHHAVVPDLQNVQLYSFREDIYVYICSCAYSYSHSNSNSCSHIYMYMCKYVYVSVYTHTYTMSKASKALLFTLSFFLFLLSLSYWQFVICLYCYLQECVYWHSD